MIPLKNFENVILQTFFLSLLVEGKGVGCFAKAKFIRGDLDKAEEESQLITEDATEQEQEGENVEEKQEKESETSDATDEAERGLNEFINGVESQVHEEFKSKITTKTVTQDGEVVSETEEETEEYFEYIREKGVGLISGAETAGKWKSDDKTEYYYALTIEMK